MMSGANSGTRNEDGVINTFIVIEGLPENQVTIEFIINE